jgi:hypothetical protein
MAKSGRMDAYYRSIPRQVEYVFENFREASESARDFILVYEGQFGRFPFWYARANTEFGNVFGRDISPEDAQWGHTHRPADDPMSLKEQLEKAEAAQGLIDRFEQQQDERPRSRAREKGNMAPAKERYKLVAERGAEIMLKLRAKHFADRNAGRDTDTGISITELGTDSITRDALKSRVERKYVEIVNGMVRFAGSGFSEAFRIEESRGKTPERKQQPEASMFGHKG